MALRCPEGHLLVRETSHLGETISCDGGCRHEIAPGDPRLICTDCDYDVCFECAQRSDVECPVADAPPPEPALPEPALPPNDGGLRSALRWRVLHYVSTTSLAGADGGGGSAPMLRAGSVWSGTLEGEQCQLLVSHRDAHVLEAACVWLARDGTSAGCATRLEGRVHVNHRACVQLLELCSDQVAQLCQGREHAREHARGAMRDTVHGTVQSCAHMGMLCAASFADAHRHTTAVQLPQIMCLLHYYLRLT